MISLLRYGKNSVDRLHDDLSIQDSTKNNTVIGNQTSKTIAQFSSCSIKDVCFSYPRSDKKVIENLNIDFKFGELTGIVGPSGSGKTTVVDLIMGLLSPTSGEILYDGKVNHDPNRILSSISYPARSFCYKFFHKSKHSFRREFAKLIWKNYMNL